MKPIKFVPPLDRNYASNFFDDNLSVKEHNEILKNFNERALYVFGKIAELLNLKYSWVTFDNVDLDQSYKILGNFDFIAYKDTVSFFSDLDILEYNNREILKYDNKFPAKFLIEDFEDELLLDIEKIKKGIDEKSARSKAKRERKRQKEKERDKIRPEIIASIKNKLTELELSFIEFK